MHQRLAGLRGLERDGPEQAGPEAADAAVALKQFALVVVLRAAGPGSRPGPPPPRVGAWGRGRRPWDRTRARATGLVEQDRAGLAELQRGRIQVAERAEPCLFSGALGLGQQVRDDQVQQVQGVVQRRGLEGPGEGQQGGDPPVPWHPRDRRRPGRGGMTGQGLEPTRGHSRQVEFRDAQGADLLESLAGRRPGPGRSPGSGPRRSRSRWLWRAPSGTTSNASSRARCAALGAAARTRQRRAAARSRAWATRRARTVTPGSKTLRSTSQAVARSNSRLGRSALTQARA